MAKLKNLFYIKADCVLASPLCISKGISEETDNDVHKNINLDPVIPATSIAGSLLDYETKLNLCAKNDLTDDLKTVFGYSDRTETRRSSLFISDSIISNAVITKRDGIKLDDTKQTENGAKFDYEIVETGAKLTLFFEYREWENSTANYRGIIADCFAAINSGIIRFGSNKNRGLGKIKIESASCAEFSLNNVNDLVDFDKYSYDKWEEFSIPQECLMNKNFIKIVIPVKSNGGLSIRQYHAVKDEPDFKQITCNDKAVIPGSSLNGAIRHKCKEILKDFSATDKQMKLFDEYWGKLDNKKSFTSNIVFSESIMNNGAMIPMTRSSINRFTGGTTSGALYSELTYAGGDTEFEIMLKKSNKNYKWIGGLLLLAVQLLEHGYLPIGGQTAIGRGVFELNGEAKIFGTDKEDLSDALKVEIERGNK